MIDILSVAAFLVLSWLIISLVEDNIAVTAMAVITTLLVVSASMFHWKQVWNDAEISADKYRMVMAPIQIDPTIKQQYQAKGYISNKEYIQSVGRMSQRRDASIREDIEARLGK